MKIAYIGTPKISAGLLERLIPRQAELGIEIALVVTQPDMPVGRKQVLTPSPVKELARRHNLLISDDLGVLKTQNVELALLFAFGRIIPQEILDVPTHGFWNIHPSLLPAYRGASPITFPIFLGDKESGVTLMQMDADLDHGPIISQVPFSIPGTSLREDIEEQVIEIAFNQIRESLVQLSTHKSVAVVQQNHSLATFTRPLTKQDGFVERSIVLKAIKGEPILDTELPLLIQEYYSKNKSPYPDSPRLANQVLYDLHRALHGWPGIWTIISDNGAEKRLKLLDISLGSEGLLIHTVQLEGKNPVDYTTFAKAYGSL